jgi:hypothetical protein
MDNDAPRLAEQGRPAKAGPATAACGAQVLTKEAKSAREEHDRVTLHVDTEPLLQEDCAQYGGARCRERERQAAGRAGRRSALMRPATAGEAEGELTPLLGTSHCVCRKLLSVVSSARVGRCFPSSGRLP